LPYSPHDVAKVQNNRETAKDFFNFVFIFWCFARFALPLPTNFKKTTIWMK